MHTELNQPPRNTHHYNAPDNSINLSTWQARSTPSRPQMKGRYCTLVNTALEHSASLYSAFQGNSEQNWRWLPEEKPESATDYHDWLSKVLSRENQFFYTVMAPDNRAVGILSYLRVDTENGSIEVGNIHFCDEIKQSVMTTEALFLMLTYIFDELGYRRCEWKCNTQNHRSRQSAERLGFTFEGIFRQHSIVKGQNRDTAWFSMLDKEWVVLKPEFERWLQTDNFQKDGTQVSRLNCGKLVGEQNS